VMSDIEDRIQQLKVIYASAGTGKTHRLSKAYLQSLETTKDSVGALGIIATTFTKKAANELSERVRLMLLEEGNWQAAQEVLIGYLGTVNSVCGRLLSEYAIEAGLSPDATVIGEEQLAAVFSVAVDIVINDFAEEIDSAANRLQIEW